MTVNLGRAYCQVGGAGCAAAAEISCICAQHILNGSQGLAGNGRLFFCYLGCYLYRLVQSAFQGLVKGCLGSRHVNHPAGYRVRNDKLSVFSGYRCILGLCRDSLALCIHKVLHLRGIHLCLQFNLHGRCRQIFFNHVLFNQAAAGILADRLINYVCVNPVKAQFPCCGGHILSIHAEGH